MSNGQYDRIIFEQTKRYGLDPDLVKAIIQAESNWDPRAYRREPHIRDASYGLMQVLYGTAQQMGFTGPREQLFDPQTNITYGIKYLNYLRIQFPGDTERQIAAYNAGPGNAARRSDGSFFNQNYVNRVSSFYARYRQQTADQDQDVVQLRPENRQRGLAPASPPIRIRAEKTAKGDIDAAMETFLTPENAPWILVGGFVLLHTLINGGGKR